MACWKKKIKIKTEPGGISEHSLQKILEVALRGILEDYSHF